MKVGQIVLFYSSTVGDQNLGRGWNGQRSGPYPAIITQVFDPAYCNLKVFLPFTTSADFGSVPEKGSEFDKSSEDNFHYWEGLK